MLYFWKVLSFWWKDETKQNKNNSKSTAMLGLFKKAHRSSLAPESRQYRHEASYSLNDAHMPKAFLDVDTWANRHQN